MKRVALYIIILYNVLLLAGCHDTLVPPEDIVPRDEAERTVVVYMAGDNSLSSAVSADTTEMILAGSRIPADVNFVLFIDSKNHQPAIYELTAAKGMTLWKQYAEEMCSTDSLTMLNVLQEIARYFPARHYGLTLWSHASGWTTRRNTFGKDETHDKGAARNEMEIATLRDVLTQLPRFDYIFFDACFMQCIEVAYELRGATSYMVGSPAEIPGPGAPYDKIMDALCQGDAFGIVEGYDANYPGRYSGYYYPGVLLSCIDCSELEPLAEATGQLLMPFYREKTEPATTGFQAYCDRFLNKYTHFYDMRTTMCRLLPDETYAQWQNLFDKAVPLRTLSPSRQWFANYCTFPYVDDSSCYGGVSMFLPKQEYEEFGWNADFRQTSWYDATGWQATGW